MQFYSLFYNINFEDLRPVKLKAGQIALN